jgi:hypothetical protein
MQLFVWESDVTQAGDGRVVITARKPLSHMSRKQAAKVLGCSEWTVSDLFRLGLLNGYKPGARRKRKDGRASNAALRLDSESVLRYKAERLADARSSRR